MNALAVPSRAVTCEADSMVPALTETELEQAISRSLTRMLRMAVRLSGDREIAEEAVQDALLRVAGSWRSFRGEAALETWFGRIVIHCVRDQLARKRRPNVSLEDAKEPVDAVVNGPLQQALVSEQQQRVRLAVTKLPDRQREVLTLSLWEAKSTAEIAELLEITAQNVHANLHAARQRLKMILTDDAIP